MYAACSLPRLFPDALPGTCGFCFYSTSLISQGGRSYTERPSHTSARSLFQIARHVGRVGRWRQRGRILVLAEEMGSISAHGKGQDPVKSSYHPRNILFNTTYSMTIIETHCLFSRQTRGSLNLRMSRSSCRMVEEYLTPKTKLNVSHRHSCRARQLIPSLVPTLVQSAAVRYYSRR